MEHSRASMDPAASLGDLRSRAALFPGPPVAVSLANCDMEALAQPSPSQVEAYELYLHLPELTSLWRQQSKVTPPWRNERVVRPALHGLELLFRLISSVLCDARPYVDRDEWLRRLESLASAQLEILSCVVEGDEEAPTLMATATTSLSSGTTVGWQKAVVSRVSKESLLPRLASWRTAQAVSGRLQLAIEGHMARAPFTLGLGEPNLTGKPVLEYDLICQPLEVYACRQSMPGSPEDHTLSTVHQMMEAWLEVASDLLRSVEENVKAGNCRAAAKSCWSLERVWKLLVATLDLLHVMDPDDFMRLKEELAISQDDGTAASTERIGGGAYCLRSTRLRSVTKACKELRHLLPQVVGVTPDPRGGPRLQEAVMSLLHSHGTSTGTDTGTGISSRSIRASSRAFHSSTIHLLQAFQAVEAAVRNFYFAYQQLVVSVMGSGEFKATLVTPKDAAHPPRKVMDPSSLSSLSSLSSSSSSSLVSAADALSQIYFEPPYFPSLDGAKTFLGSFWHHHPELDEGAIMRQLLVDKRGREKEEDGRGSSGSGGGGGGGENSSVETSDSGESKSEDEESRSPNKKSAGSMEKKQFTNAALAYSSNRHMYQGAMGA